eukprot:CAMPEP_0184504242 /NCGR_PEP_ID=MMETSP0113_2-20130426/52357_1 /TAXON_ID=91329 /ORGANISM="Norrisiella sphaerica, Strain BC52" /LENGTH=114 /DNA_ID=CAMNT_0026893867 /DNA_START=2050 /DNA_END=2394 /DNA_ORIENTATION=-
MASAVAEATPLMDQEVKSLIDGILSAPIASMISPLCINAMASFPVNHPYVVPDLTYILLSERYLGIVLGVMVLLTCASGMLEVKLETKSSEAITQVCPGEILSVSLSDKNIELP